MAQSMGLTTPALQSVDKLMHDGALWSLLPLAIMTGAAKNRAACLLSQAGARVAGLMAEHQNYPFKLFGLLTDMDGRLASSIAVESECRFDA